MPTNTPIWTTSSRLLKLGESINFQFCVPEGLSSGDLFIYPRYLETAHPGEAFKAGEGLNWVQELEHETINLEFIHNHAFYNYRPTLPGNYLAVWLVGDDIFYRYFSVVEDDYIVLAFSTFTFLESEPTLHATGIPLDYRLPIDAFDPDNPIFARLHSYNQRYGDLIVPLFADTPTLSHEERVKLYGEGIQRVRNLMPDPNDSRSIRVEANHEAEPGYPRAFAEIGVSDHCGLWEANCKPWLGMPEFPYYSSPEDCRKMDQSDKGSVVSHQWDFCGGFHFLGPVQWHYAASEGRMEVTQECLRRGMDEFANLAQMSGHPAFVTPLYDGIEKNPAFGVYSSYPNPSYPNPVFNDGYGTDQIFQYVEDYQRLFAFEFTNKYKVVYARSIDIVDYYLRHYNTTPRTVHVSKTPHILYDAWWTQGTVANYGIMITPERIPWITKISTVHKMRKEAVLPHLKELIPLKDPMSCEFILIEEPKRAIRFERECPNPIWWFDYTRNDVNRNGSIINAVATPDVFIMRSQIYDKEIGLTINLKMNTEEYFPGYVIALWNLPVSYKSESQDIDTNATKYELVKNTDGEVHMVLHFDLKPDSQIKVVLRRPIAERWKW